MSARLAFDGVACARRGRTLFENLSFALEAGEALIVTGANGVGKSSLIRVAAGLLAPAAGAVAHDGARALLAEAAALDAERDVAAALTFWARLDERPAPETRVAAALDTLDLAALADVPVRLLSTGQRRRVGFARVLASEAPIWLLDEPANGLDHAAVNRLESAIAAHRARGGIALVATHQPLALADTRELRL
ncbi:heme ABC exporter ATP-binding protein CcmA [uncultured Sphingomonas sp.]|uniref:heme ABC exporter ATP-binding protein CcmA n=1 Tax=uncultured Sphingomonas sp. TaxID=158754 RepID=UPI002621D66E|nr:heme ABC exporter ATP-binding protein CcmA [uncultured Sphingomonas sp.]